LFDKFARLKVCTIIGRLFISRRGFFLSLFEFNLDGIRPNIIDFDF